MKKVITLLLITSLYNLSFSQNLKELWDWQGYSIGQDATGSAVTSETFMPEVKRIGSQYVMYYTGRYSNRSCISYATSSDMLTWTVQDTIITGATDTTSREYEIGGPSVMKLTNGQYRMFYRTCQKFQVGPPKYHIRSLISNDGITFTKEGVRIDIQPYVANSYFTLAGQSTFYKDAGGTTRALISGSDSSGGNNKIYVASSTDEGATWSGFGALYSNCHDPVVITDSTGKYHMYCSYLLQGNRKAESTDGAGWPSSTDSVLLRQGTSSLNEQSSPYMIADLGAAVDATGKIVLYSNYKPYTPGPWKDVAYYFEAATSGVGNYNSQASSVVFPNPAEDYVEIKTVAGNSFSDFEICNSLGQEVMKGKLTPSKRIPLKGLNGGTYFLHISSALTQESINTTLIKK